MVDIADNEYATSDTPLAAHLKTEGYPLKDILFDGPIAHFVFSKDRNGIEKCARAFELLNAQSSNATLLIENFRQLIKATKRGY